MFKQQYSNVMIEEQKEDESQTRSFLMQKESQNEGIFSSIYQSVHDESINAKKGTIELADDQEVHVSNQT